VRKAEPLARYTALRVGGPAELLVVAEEVAALRAAAELARQHGVACRILGGGSNALVSDAGVRGLVVLNRAGKVTFGGGEVWAESGASFSTLARRCVSRGLAGLEWAAGIPGTVGGAVVGNAGAWGGDVASVLDRVRVLEPDGTVALWPAERMGYGYRSSVLKGQGAGGERQTVVLEALFRLQPGEAQSLEQRLAEITQQRKSSQPPGATCGSVFKNPPGDYAGRLIEAAGLKGTSHGGAVISPVHANFVVNQGGATAGDVKALIDLARREVEAGTGVRLELEIELLGEWQ
jgi:UDP-N-acetylmuramate dehydrogenase